MGVLDTSYTFTATDVVTSGKLNNLIDQTTFTSSAVTGTTLAVISGSLKVASGGITSNELSSNLNLSGITTGSFSGSLAGTATASITAITATNSTYASSSPINGTFTAANSANVTKILVQGYGFGIGEGIGFQAGNNNGAALAFRNQSTTIVGSVVNTDTGTYYNVSSDYRLKEELRDIACPIETILKLKPINFKWKSCDKRIDGFLAHEVQEVIPNAVSGVKDAVDSDGEPIIQQLDLSKIVPLLVAAVQELSRKVKELEDNREYF